MIKNYEMRRALTSAQLAKDTSTEVLKQLIVKNAVRLGQTLSDVELEVITSDLQTYLSGLPISFAEVSLVLREGVNGNLSTDKVYKMTSSAVQGWFDSYFKMYAKQRATLVAELQGADFKKLTAGATDPTAILQESIKRDFEEYKKETYPHKLKNYRTFVDEELDVYVGNIKKFSAVPGASKESYAVRITSVNREEE